MCGRKASAAVFDAAKLLETASTNMVMRGGEVYRTSRCVYSMNGLMQADSSVFDLSEERCLRMLTMAECVAAVCADGKLPTGYAEPSHEWTQKLLTKLDDLCHQRWSKNGRIVFDSGMSARIMREESAGEIIIAFAGVETENDGRIEAALSAVLSG